ncbi:MAG: acyl-CoA dehydrogenase, partial [Sandaracinus sp.]|nr:acyl-CoA dehydrogenase [Sandaracinus sp.]
MTIKEPFNQPPPQLANQWDDDAVLREHLERKLPADAYAAIDGEMRELGQWAVEMQEVVQRDRLNEPVLTHWDAWGERIDHIELTEVWKKAE